MASGDHFVIHKSLSRPLRSRVRKYTEMAGQAFFGAMNHFARVGHAERERMRVLFR
jgi:hypothetical protein